MEGSLIVVGTGIAWAGQTTLAARTAIERADCVLYAVADPFAAKWIVSLHPGAQSLPYPRDDRPRQAIYEAMVTRILAELRQQKRVCVVFYGHPGVLAVAPHQAIRRAQEEGYSARMLPGVSAIDCLFADLGVDPGEDGCQIFTASDFLLRSRIINDSVPLVLLQIAMIGNRGVFADHSSQIRDGLQVLVEVLTQVFAVDHNVVIYEAAAQPLDRPRIDHVALGALASASVSELSTLYVPSSSRAPIDRLMLERLNLHLTRPFLAEA